MSKIEWTDKTWNPVTGCDKVSPGCQFCYAERMAKRLNAMGQERYRNGFRVTYHPEVLNHPKTWKKPHVIFVCSMSDLFHKDVEFSQVRSIWEVMRDTPWHTYQVLTKRPERMAKLTQSWPKLPNVWLGTSVESEAQYGRIDHLKRSSAETRFLSLEPLLSPMPNLNLSGIDWVIVGGESGVGARPMKDYWVREIRDKCQAEGVPFFFKQWGGLYPKRNGRELDGMTWDQMPKSYNKDHAPSFA